MLPVLFPSLQILLSNRLDNVNSFKYTAITVPLLLSLATLVCLSFGSKGGNNCEYSARYSVRDEELLCYSNGGKLLYCDNDGETATMLMGNSMYQYSTF